MAKRTPTSLSSSLSNMALGGTAARSATTGVHASAPAEIGAVGDFRARLAGVFAGDDETLLIDERERAEDHRVSDREQRGVRADPEAEDQNNDAREGRCPPQRPRRESQSPHAAHCSR